MFTRADLIRFTAIAAFILALLAVWRTAGSALGWNPSVALTGSRSD